MFDPPAVMRHRWAHLLFLHWEVPADDLRRLLPPGLELDTYHGRAFVGLVPFTMTGLRPVGLPALPILSDSHETNVRTYVRHRGRNPGVWFFSLDASNPTAVRIAKALWNLNYVHARQRIGFTNGSIAYHSDRRKARLRVHYSPVGAPAASEPGTLQHFLVERYVLYAWNGRRLFTGRVEHVPYPVQPAVVHSLEESLLEANGIRRPLSAPLAAYSAEVAVRVFAPYPID